MPQAYPSDPQVRSAFRRVAVRRPGIAGKWIVVGLNGARANRTKGRVF